VSDKFVLNEIGKLIIKKINIIAIATPNNTMWLKITACAGINIKNIIMKLTTVLLMMSYLS
jgi:hypothetical protein